MNRRVVRGGGWINEPRILRPAYRSRSNAGAAFNILGFRLVRLPKESGRRVVRCGSWLDYQWLARCAYRFRYPPEDFNDLLGFRLIRRKYE